LKLLNDLSSIERTYNSNHTLHTLTTLRLPYFSDAKYFETKKHIASAINTLTLIASAININDENRGNSHAAGRAKVIATQLNRNARMELCRLQGVEYSYGSIYAAIEPVLLPDLLALTGGEHGQNELYRMLVATAPNLTSLINKKSMLKETIARNMARMTALTAEYSRQSSYLTAENFDLNRRLESIESAENTQSTVMERRINMNICGKKRKC